MQVIEAQRASILVPHDHLHISHPCPGWRRNDVKGRQAGRGSGLGFAAARGCGQAGLCGW